MGAEGRSPRWTAGRVGSAVVFLAFLLGVQLLVPASRVVEDRPIRFGWHMYAHGPDRVVFRVIGPDGVSDVVSGSGLLARKRPEIRAERWIPEALCARAPEARRVEIEIDGHATAHHECD